MYKVSIVEQFLDTPEDILSVVERSSKELSLGNLLASAVAGIETPRRCLIAAEIAADLIDRGAAYGCDGVVTDEMIEDFYQSASAIVSAWREEDERSVSIPFPAAKEEAK